MRNQTMTPEHPQWNDFCDRLGGDEGCTFTEDLKWKCHHDYRFATKILDSIDGINTEQSIAYFRENGGYCDCEILFNVDKADRSDD